MCLLMLSQSTTVSHRHYVQLSLLLLGLIQSTSSSLMIDPICIFSTMVQCEDYDWSHLHHHDQCHLDCLYLNQHDWSHSRYHLYLYHDRFSSAPSWFMIDPICTLIIMIYSMYTLTIHSKYHPSPICTYSRSFQSSPPWLTVMVRV